MRCGIKPSLERSRPANGDVMSTAAWRRLLLALCAFALLQLGVCAWLQGARFAVLPGFDVPFFGTAPNANSVQMSPTRTPQVFMLTFPPSSPLAAQGVRSGDLLDLRNASPGERYRWWTKFWWAGEQVRADILHGHAPKRVTLTAQWVPLDWYGAVANVGICWMLLFATLLAWRRPDDPEARTLALLLILINLGLNFQPQNWISPWPALDATLSSLSAPVSSAGLVLFATYAMLFARPPSAWRRALVWTAYAAAIVNAVFELALPGAIAFALPGAALLSNALFEGTFSPLPFVFPAVCVLATIPATHGAERARITWASIPLLPLYIIAWIPSPALSGAAAVWILYTYNIILFLAPLGLTYSLLSCRLLDIGFALNRAAVFAVTSLLLAGLFAALQWLANTLVASLVRVHNITVDMTIVVIVYFVARSSRTAVERVITRVFFAARDRRLQALRELERAVDDVSDPDALAPFVVEYLRTRVEIAAAVYLQAADGWLRPAAGGAPETAPISPDHVALVLLRSARVPTDAPEWSDLGTAFPMLVRGRLRGIVFCRAPNDGAFAPDETHALERLANRMASDREDLLAESLRAELDDLRVQMFELRATGNG